MMMSVQLPETDGACPHCGKKLPGYQRGQSDYGSPIVTCKKCGKRYLDRRYHEIAVEGFVRNDLSLRRDGVMALLGVGFFAAGFALNYHMVLTLGRYSVRNVFIQLFALLFLLAAAVDAVMILTGVKAKRLDKKREQSVARLRNLAYAHELADLGYAVPEEYL